VERHGRAIDLFTPQWAYVGRSVLAAALALGLAYVLQLETPYSAASTVLLIANANHGAVLAKGAWRVIGTLIGGAVAIVLMALFAQMPALFILGFGVWLGLCAAAATLLRHFRASGAAVAGYTIGLATYGALEAPDLTLAHTLGRVATVILGVVCAGIVTALLSPRSTRVLLEARLTQLTAEVGRGLLAHLRGAAPRDGATSAALAGEIVAVDDLLVLVLASAESTDVALRAGAVRDAMAALFAAQAGGAALRPPQHSSHPLVAEARARAETAVQQAVAAFDAGAAGVTTAHVLLATACKDFRRLTALAEAGDDLDVFIAIERISEVLADYTAALAGHVRLQDKRSGRRRRLRAPFHRDWRGAIDNGLRALLAIVLGGAVWIATGWSGGPLMLLVLAPYCVLLAMTGNPAAGAVEFIKGTIAAVPLSLVCAFAILPRIDGFPLLLAALAPFWAAGLYATTMPKFAPAGLAYLVAFNTLVGATNPMTFDLAAYLNQAAGWIVAVFVTLLAFRLLLPRDPARDGRRVAAAIAADVRALLTQAASDRVAFEHLQQHRLSRIGVLLKGDAQLAAVTARALATLHVGRAILRVHAASAASDSSARRMAAAGLAHLSAGRLAPADCARRAAADLASLAPAETATAQVRHRLIMAFQEIAVLLDDDHSLFALAGGR